MNTRRFAVGWNGLVPCAVALVFSLMPAQGVAQQRQGPRVPEGTRVIKDQAYVTHGHERQKLDLYLPAQGKDWPLVVWVHGGAWRGGSKERPPALAMRLLSEGYAVASVNYRLSQHATFPAQIQDVKAAVRWLRASAKAHGYDADRVAAWGASAGGHLVALLGTAGDVKEFDVGEHLEQSSRVQAVVDFFGPTDFLQMNAQAGEQGRQDHDAADSPESRLIGAPIQQNKEKVAKANPLTYASKDDPPFLIMHGERDFTVAIGQSELLHAALEKAGASSTFRPVPNAGHGFRGAEIDRTVLGFLGQHLKGEKQSGTVHQWGVVERALTTAREYPRPLWDVDVAVDLQSPSGKKRSVAAFWDGGRTWRFRFSPDEVGQWRWTTRATDASDDGLHGRQGTAECVAYEGDNPLYKHGPVVVSNDGRHFTHGDGTPFFWLGDTAWNGALRSTEADWQRYLKTRREQRFTAIQFVTTQWRGATEVLPEPVFTTADGKIGLNLHALRRIDQRLSAVNEHGLLAAPVMLWALWKTDPGQSLPEADAIRLARYMADRWGAHQVVWFLGGDGRFTGEAAPRWRNIGRGVFGDRPHRRPVTLHPLGGGWPLSDFAAEDWYDFVGYQSSHTARPERLRWMVGGPPASDWKQGRPRPFINLEPNYEGHPGAPGGTNFTPFHVRRAAWWSCLVSPTAGVSYGNNPIWVWNDEPAPAEGHEGLGEIAPWEAGLETEGVQDMTLLARFFESGPWHRLRPAPDLLAKQPGESDPDRFVAAGATDDGKWVVVYTPTGGRIVLDGRRLKEGRRARWFDPRTGQFKEAAGEGDAYPAPDEQDWVLEVRAE